MRIRGERHVSDSNARNSTRVLIVDDHALVRTMVRRILETTEDFVIVGEASTGEEALRLVRSKAPGVILLDLDMPEGSGVDVLRQIKEENLNAQTLILSAHESAENAHKLLQEGASGYLTKQQTPDQVVEAVRAVAEGGERWFVRPSVSGKADTTSEANLTGREREVLHLMAEGHNNAKIAERLCIAEETVRTHLSRVYRKIGAHSAREAVSWAWRNKMVDRV